jgi:hypothetical protein
MQLEDDHMEDVEGDGRIVLKCGKKKVKLSVCLIN